MAKRVFSRMKSSRKRTSEFSSVSDGGMFESRPFVVQSKVGEAGEKSGLKTSLMRAERYGHHLSQMQPTVSNGKVVQKTSSDSPEKPDKNPNRKRTKSEQKKPNKKRKINGSPSQEDQSYLPRREDAGVGTQVNFLKDRHFRTERRLRRRMKNKGGERNFYTVSHTLPNRERPIRVVTVSRPPQDKSKYNQIGHSEQIHHNIEGNNYADIQKGNRRYEATTREQCEGCRFKYPSKVVPQNHYYGFPYSAPIDHIQDNDLRQQIISNNGVKGKLRLSPSHQQEFTTASKSAKKARQGTEQNEKLRQAIKDLATTDSSSEYSSDEHEIHIDPAVYDLFNQENKNITKIGKANVKKIPLSPTISKDSGSPSAGQEKQTKEIRRGKQQMGEERGSSSQTTGFSEEEMEQAIRESRREQFERQRAEQFGPRNYEQGEGSSKTHRRKK